jgi:hypothetical protein
MKGASQACRALRGIWGRGVPTLAQPPRQSHFDFSNSTSIGYLPFSIHLEARASVEDFVFTNAGDITKITTQSAHTFSAHAQRSVQPRKYALHVLLTRWQPHVTRPGVVRADASPGRNAVQLPVEWTSEHDGGHSR